MNYYFKAQDSKKLFLDNDAIESLFLNQFKIPNLQHPFGDDKSLFKMNSEGFRSDDFKNNPEILFSGCSFTYGCGIEADYVWTKLVANDLNTGHYNLGVPGASAQLIVHNLFEYFRKYGNPKNLFVLFPNLERTLRVVNMNYGYNEHYTDNQIKAQKKNRKNKNNYWENVFTYGLEFEIEKYIKLPTKTSNIFATDTALLLNMCAINSLIQYCESNKINFLWSVNDPGMMSFFKILKQKHTDRFKSLINLELEGFNWDEKNKNFTNKYLKNCHLELYNENPERFDVGFDKDSKGNPHWGTHIHRHVADKFIETIQYV